MQGTLVDPLPDTEPTELSELVRRLCREVVELRQEVADLRRENAELRQQVGYWKAQHARAVHRAEQLEAEVEQLRGESRKLQEQLFGRKSETASIQDRSNGLEGEDDQASSPSAKRGQRTDRPGPARRDYSHLPVVEELRELPDDRRVCPQCGAALSPSDTEDSEQIEIEVRAYRRLIRRRRYQRTCSCGNCPRTVTAPPAPKLIPKGVLGVSVWVEILLEKFFSHRPTERLLAQWRLLGLDVAAGTVAGGLERLEPLFQPLYDALLLRNAAAAFAQADETRWMVFVTQEGKTGYRWWLWVFLSEDTVVFRLDPTRSHDVPEGHFPADARVVLMVDRYAAYKAMAQVKLGHVVLVFCWAHVRRDFVTVGKGWPEHKEWALAWLRRIRALYRHDRRRRSAQASSGEFTAADVELRQTVAAMQTQADAELADPKLPTPCRKVLTSLQEHWSGLTRFQENRRIPLDNNASERRVRGPALGRKNYYGSGALWSGRLAATLFSLLATLSLARLNIRTWLTWYLNCCAENGGRAPSDITAFLPWEMSVEKRRELAIDPNDSS
ncbi:MAG: IS66 family transposase [Actinomycetota bacterium]|nr:IS66 family transposase [Actinomycetota bacterium]